MSVNVKLYTLVSLNGRDFVQCDFASSLHKGGSRGQSGRPPFPLPLLLAAKKKEKEKKDKKKRRKKRREKGRKRKKVGGRIGKKRQSTSICNIFSRASRSH